ncbi:tobamovirus multiplication protein 1-like isoform x1 [Anaeramoeba flamelloides]|uniref:Tobamovirus multiplication protein 1-like isoform x1 n=1 Tax=Anaeramoeba flamelloides TaxID=1746091 RepID=A0AAV7ZVP0_9EUKA|nr:tobamovirus multiplication protein 1-like isoform x1 [Anaeramoeba flamelloides]
MVTLLHGTELQEKTAQIIYLASNLIISIFLVIYLKTLFVQKEALKNKKKNWRNFSIVLLFGLLLEITSSILYITFPTDQFEIQMIFSILGNCVTLLCYSIFIFFWLKTLEIYFGGNYSFNLDEFTSKKVWICRFKFSVFFKIVNAIFVLGIVAYVLSIVKKPNNEEKVLRYKQIYILFQYSFLFFATWIWAFSGIIYGNKFLQLIKSLNINEKKMASITKVTRYVLKSSFLYLIQGICFLIEIPMDDAEKRPNILTFILWLFYNIIKYSIIIIYLISISLIVRNYKKDIKRRSQNKDVEKGSSSLTESSRNNE